MNKKLSEIVTGILLSDGNIEKSGSTSILALQQSGDKRHKPWVYELAEILKKQGLGTGYVSSMPPRSSFSIPRGWIHSGNGWRARSKSCKEFAVLRKRWYPKDIKIVPKEIKLTCRSVAHWIAGDGSLYKRSGYLKIYTNGFTKKDIDRLCVLLRNLFQIRTPHSLAQGKRWTIYISKSDYIKVSKKINKYMPKGMEYKLAEEAR